MFDIDWLLHLEYKKSPFKYVTICMLYMFVAIIAAITINLVGKSIQKMFGLTPVLAALTHMVVLALGLYIIEMHLLKRFAADWQSTTPGFLFAGFLITFQPTLLENIPHLIKYITKVLGV